MNRLAQSSSPYLLQHAHNPVDWYPWGPEALARARELDRPIIVSIGYSACHWCHVMERESFENPNLAHLMNEHFVCIKVDREERPDVDQIYMEAVQAMGLGGGWPLNVFLTPDARPFYGGTYFRPAQWGQLLPQIAEAYQTHREKIEQSAGEFAAVLNRSEAAHYGLQAPADTTQLLFPPALAVEMYAALAQRFDWEQGGLNRAPKFPMPSIYQFLLRFHHAFDHAESLTQAELTLQKMAWGGLYDQLGGGFARYSVDGEWFAPHFEKMLYDNAQLLSLYAEAHLLAPQPLYRQVIEETVQFVARELTSPEGGFYCALDADSEGTEGRYYVWTHAELAAALAQVPVPNALALVQDYYHCYPDGNWEHEYNILHRRQTDETWAAQHQLDPEQASATLGTLKQALLRARATRVRPALDDKILTGWNGLMIKGLCDAYLATGQVSYLQMAQRNATFIRQNLLKDGLRLARNYKNGQASLDANLEDYASLIHGLLGLYQAGFDDQWLQLAADLAQHVQTHFWDPAEHLFFFTAHYAEALIARKKEIFDNVIPASNSLMAHNLYWLGHLLGHDAYIAQAKRMLAVISPLLNRDPSHLAHWGSLLMAQYGPTAEVVVSGPAFAQVAARLQQRYWPNKVMAAAGTPSPWPLLAGRDPKPDGATYIYVCVNRTCQLPTTSVEAAWGQLDDID